MSLRLRDARAFNQHHERCRQGDVPGWMYEPKWPVSLIEELA